MIPCCDTRPFLIYLTISKGYTDFFLLQYLVDEREQIKFYLPFDDFTNPPIFATLDDYLLYKSTLPSSHKAV
jgi:hypothetical protein